MPMRFAVLILIAVITAACSKSSEPVRHAKITRFAASDKLIPRGVTGKLCYGVENATRLSLDPPIEEILPSEARCINISPQHKTTYTLTAFAADGSTDTKKVEVSAGAEPPRIFDLKASATEVRRGQAVRICFQVENATEVKGKPGKLDSSANCLSDKPRRNTTYRIVAYGGDHQEDSGTVSVKVR